MEMQIPEHFVIGNAAGTVKTIEDVAHMCRSAATRITVGSITKEERPGNAGDVYYYDDTTETSINALGLPNPGLKAYRSLLPQMVRAAEAAGKELWASVAGFSPGEFAELTETCFACGVDGVELNLGCPNVHDSGKSKPIFSYEPKMTAAVLAQVKHLDIRGQARPKIGVKISPVPDGILEALAHEIEMSEIVTEVMACNTIPNRTLTKKDGSEALNFIAPGDSEKKHLGGLAGKALQEESLRVIEALTWAWLPQGIGVIALGGVSSGKDLKRYLEEDIAGFQCATALLGHGTLNPRIFSDILQEYADIPEQKSGNQTSTHV